MFSQNNKELNLRLAETAMRHATWTCVYDDDNENEGRTSCKFADELMLKVRSVRVYSESQQKKNILVYAKQALRYRVGRCEEQSCLTIIYLLSMGVFNIHKFSMEGGGDHVFLVIGNWNNDSDLLRPETIPADAIVIDTWAKEFYPARKFKKYAEAGDAYLKGTPVLQYSFERDGLGKFNTSREARSQFQQEMNAFIAKYLVYRKHSPKRARAYLNPLMQEISQFKDKEDKSELIKLNAQRASLFYARKIASDKEKFTQTYVRENKYTDWVNTLVCDLLAQAIEKGPSSVNVDLPQLVKSCPIQDFQNMDIMKIISAMVNKHRPDIQHKEAFIYIQKIMMNLGKTLIESSSTHSRNIKNEKKLI